jgi:ribosomal protein S19E (S16A)
MAWVKEAKTDIIDGIVADIFDTGTTYGSDAISGKVVEDMVDSYRDIIIKRVIKELEASGYVIEE